MGDNKAPGEIERGDSGGAGSPAGGIYDNHDGSLAGYAKSVMEECAQDYKENTSWRHEGGEVPADGKLTKAHKNTNFSTAEAVDRGSSEPPAAATFAGDLAGSKGKKDY